jgi:hypothetical protein
LKISVLLYSPVGEYNSLIHQFDQSTCRICKASDTRAIFLLRWLRKG